MRLKEILTETQIQEGPILNKIGSAVGGFSKGLGAVAGGISGIGQAMKKGYAAGKSTVGNAGDPAKPSSATAKTSSTTAEPQPKTEPEIEPSTDQSKPSAQQFADKLQSMFDQFVDQDGSIGSPAVRSVIKNMWMRSGGTKAESVDEAGLMGKLGTKVGQAAYTTGKVAAQAVDAVQQAKADPEHSKNLVKAFARGQVAKDPNAAPPVEDRSGTVPRPIIEKLNELTLKERAELHKLLVQKTV